MTKISSIYKGMVWMAAGFLVTTSGCKKSGSAGGDPSASATQVWPEVGTQKVIVLKRNRTGDGSHPEFLSATLAPGRGMNVLQITAWLPGKGEVPLLATPSIEDAAKTLNADAPDGPGNSSFTMGGAILFPYANRLTGTLSANKQTETVSWQDSTAQVPANWQGKNPGAKVLAMHGMLLNSRADVVDLNALSDSATAKATYHWKANGRWFSNNDVVIEATLDADSFTLMVQAINTGGDPEPVGIGWHPYFRLPSGNRANARLYVPALARALTNNYDDVLPTGKLSKVQGTPYDFSVDGGAPLPPGQLVDDAFVQLMRNADGGATCTLEDTASDYGIRVEAVSPRIRAFQVYSPPTSSFVAIEPQFNYADPFGSEWSGEDTGMVTVEPGRDVIWKTRLEIFQPSQANTAPAAQ